MIFKRFFQVPSALQIAQKELENTRRELLRKQAEAEYAVKMVEYYVGMSQRLSAYVVNETKAQQMRLNAENK